MPCEAPISTTPTTISAGMIPIAKPNGTKPSRKKRTGYDAILKTRFVSCVNSGMRESMSCSKAASFQLI